MVQGFISNDLGDIVLWVGLFAMFAAMMIVIGIYVPGKRENQGKGKK